MKYETYPNLEIKEDFSVIDFISLGKKGPIVKRIVFSPIEIDNVYNLEFGDVDENGEVNDSVISDNGDRNKILATLVDAVGRYTRKYPERWVIFRGSTGARTRLYRMAISLNLDELVEKFLIYCYLEQSGDIVPFSKGLKINAFLVKGK